MSSSSRPPSPKNVDLVKAAKSIVELLNRSDYDKKKLVEAIKLIPPGRLAGMLEAEPKLADFLQHEPTLNEFWAKTLADGKFFGGKIEAMQGPASTLLDRYQGHFFYTQWKNTRAQTELDKACKAGVFDALVKRCEINVSNLKNEHEVEKSQKQLSTDIETLSNLYWFPGTTYGAIVFADLGNYYGQFSEMTTVSETYFKAALELALAAEKLAEMAASNEVKPINNELTQHMQKEIETMITQSGLGDLGTAQSFFCQKLRISTADQEFSDLKKKALQRTSGASHK